MSGEAWTRLHRCLSAPGGLYSDHYMEAHIASRVKEDAREPARERHVRKMKRRTKTQETRKDQRTARETTKDPNQGKKGEEAEQRRRSGWRRTTRNLEEMVSAKRLLSPATPQEGRGSTKYAPFLGAAI
ncbi:hypothetical protein NDU88_001489 [Pleurodeles waltl]|uniref:Uncharacterized protein n=1 Tax=Pleurodeles waltl TaxID=8319 RepID=A0AAV7WIG6_PLEWA|nr:hypothetical protein NDU88_001489 [Pleurodeles waltl]